MWHKKEVLEGYNRLGLMLAYINRLQQPTW
jgi:hypothetical protein